MKGYEEKTYNPLIFRHLRGIPVVEQGFLLATKFFGSFEILGTLRKQHSKHRQSGQE